MAKKEAKSGRDLVPDWPAESAEAYAAGASAPPAKVESQVVNDNLTSNEPAADLHTEAGFVKLDLQIPISRAEPAGYVTRRLDVRIDAAEAVTLRRITLALQADHAQLASGRHVETHADAVRWLLQQAAAVRKALPLP